MSIIPSTKYIKCSFEPDANRLSDFPLSEIEVFYGITRELYSKRPDLKNYISRDEKLRADKFHYSEDRDTYISTHGLLRLILSKKLRKKPLEVVIHNDKNNKPGLVGNPLYFNITHIRDAFAFIISKYFYAGIDMENADRSIDLMSVINSYFSIDECNYILKSEPNLQENFSLLWTRKEALLKAIGTGIINNLTQIEVHEDENIINKKSFENKLCEPVYNAHFIYSEKVLDYYISIAIPDKVDINLYQINSDNIISYLD